MRVVPASPAFGVVLSGCGKLEALDFQPGLDPLEPAAVDCPSGPSAGFVSESGEDDDLAWTNGCGVVEGALEDVYAALQDTKVAVDQRGVDVWERTDDVEPEYEASFALWNTVYDLIEVEFETTWRLGPLAADDANVITEYGVRYQMTVAPPVINTMEGSVHAVDRGDGTVELRIVDRLDALQGGTDITGPKAADLYNDVRVVLEGGVPPDYADEG